MGEGAIINADGSSEKYAKRRIGRTSQPFGKITRIWKTKELTNETKIQLYETTIKPISLYGSEC